MRSLAASEFLLLNSSIAECAGAHLKNFISLIAALATSTLLVSCGAVLPIMRLNHSSDDEFKGFVKAIADHVRCELSNAVALEYSPDDPNRKLLYSWAAKLALTIRAIDKGTLSPGLTANTPPSVFTIAAGANLTTTGTREMTMTYFLPFNELLGDKSRGPKQRPQVNCDIESADSIAGNLGIHTTLKAALETWDARRTLSERIVKGPFDTITHHVTFEVAEGADATPTWKFVNITANPNSPLVSATRTTADELLITMGPDALGDRKELNASFEIERLRSVIR